MPRWVRILAALVGGVFLLWLLGALRAILTSFGLGFAIAYLLNPAVNLMEGKLQKVLGVFPWKIRARSVAVALLAVLVLVLVAAFILLVVPAAIQQVKDTAKRVPEWADTVKAKVEPLVADLNIRYPEEAEIVRERLKDAIKDLPKLAAPLGAVVGRLFSSVVDVFLFMIHVLVIPVFAFYLLSDMNDIQQGLHELVPPRHREYVLTRVREMDHLLSAFVRGQLAICFLMGIFYGFALTLCRLPMGLLVGFVTSFFSLVPYMSTVVGLPLVVVLSLLDQHSGAAALQVAAVYVLGHVLEGHFITPRVMGGSLGLHPLVVMLGILIWGTLLGFLGMLIGVPMTAALSVFWGDLKEAYRRSGFYSS